METDGMYEAFASAPDIHATNEPRWRELYKKSPPPKDGIWKFSAKDVGKYDGGPFSVASKDGKSVLKQKTDIFELAFTEYGIEGRGPNIIILHGVPSNRYQWGPVAQRLASFAYVVTFDMLGMGESSKPLFDTDHGMNMTTDRYNNKIQPFQNMWEWRRDIPYIVAFIQVMFGKEPFFFYADDWGGGQAIKMAEWVSQNPGFVDMIAVGLLDPIALDGYPVNEIQAIGRSSGLPMADFMGAMGAADQTLVQIFKNMVHNPDDVYNQYSLRPILKTYVDVDYRRSATSSSSGAGIKGPATSISLEQHPAALRVLAQRSSVLSPGLLLPYHPDDAPEGVEYSKITMHAHIMWGEKDNMMPYNQVYRFNHLLKSGRHNHVHISEIANAGHFAAVDQPNKVANAMVLFLSEIVGPENLGDVFMGFDGIWKGDEKHVINSLRELYGMISTQKQETIGNLAIRSSQRQVFTWVKTPSQYDSVKGYLENGGDPNLFNNIGQTLLQTAVKVDNLDMVKLLFEFGAFPQFSLKAYGAGLMHMAIDNKSLKIVKLLAERYHNLLMYTNKDYKTPLEYAKQIGATDIIKYLETKHAELGIRGSIKSSLIKLDKVVSKEPEKVGKLAIRSSERQVFTWVKTRQYDSVKSYLENEGDANLFNNIGQTLLQTAVKADNLDMVKLLLAFGAWPQFSFRAGGVGLMHMAIDNKSLEMVKLLTEWFHNLLIYSNEDYKTPLEYARQVSATDIIEYLEGKKVELGIRGSMKSSSITSLIKLDKNNGYYVLRKEPEIVVIPSKDEEPVHENYVFSKLDNAAAKYKIGQENTKSYTLWHMDPKTKNKNKNQIKKIDSLHHLI